MKKTSIKIEETKFQNIIKIIDGLELASNNNFKNASSLSTLMNLLNSCEIVEEELEEPKDKTD